MTRRPPGSRPPVAGDLLVRQLPLTCISPPRPALPAAHRACTVYVVCIVSNRVLQSPGTTYDSSVTQSPQSTQPHSEVLRISMLRPHYKKQLDSTLSLLRRNTLFMGKWENDRRERFLISAKKQDRLAYRPHSFIRKQRYYGPDKGLHTELHSSAHCIGSYVCFAQV